MGCATSTVKYILFIFNLLCALLGIAVIAIGAVLLGNIKSFKEFVDTVTVLNTPVIVIVLGSLIFIIAFFGCCGAIRESHCMTITYSVFLFLLMVLQIAAVTLIFVTRRQQEDLIGAAVEAVWKKSNTSTETRDYIQEKFECCGVNGPLEYLLAIPPSCQGYTVGCKTAVTNSFMKVFNWIAYVGIGIFSVELVGFIFACCLANHIRNNKRRSTY